MPTSPPNRRSWRPGLAPKGVKLFNSKKRFILLDGPRKSSKSIHACQKIAKHLYTTPQAVVCVVTKRTRSAKQGVWGDLTKFVIEGQWQREGGILPYVIPPRISSDSRQNFFSVRNGMGGTSSCFLYPLQFAHEAESVFKQTRFSAAMICEADLWGSRQLFDAVADQLRVIGLPYEAHQMILDTNPPVDGTKHWLYPLFVDPTVERTEDFERIQFLWDDNPWLDEKEKQDLVSRYKSDPLKWRRYVLGEWVMGTEGSLFEDVFRPDIHVVGEVKAGLSEDEWEVLVPPPGSNELVTGSDLGDVNHAMVIISKRYDEEGNVAFDVIDEVVSINHPVSIADFTDRFMAKVATWENYMKDNGVDDVKRDDWSDSSSFKFSATANATQAMVVRNQSGGRIILNAVVKGAGSVGARIELVRRLLFEDRLHISVKCPNLIESMSRLKSTKKSGGYIKYSTKLLHAFDAMSYALLNSVPRDLQRQYDNQNPSTDKVLSVSL